jgi:predicted Zn-ribbon and HTH transcriptional regulator
MLDLAQMSAAQYEIDRRALPPPPEIDEARAREHQRFLSNAEFRRLSGRTVSGELADAMTYSFMPGDSTVHAPPTCTHCGRTFDKAPASCPGCAGNEFK